MQTLGNAVSSAKNLIGNGPGRLLISSTFYCVLPAVPTHHHWPRRDE